jgi:hypothetical protein
VSRAALLSAAMTDERLLKVMGRRVRELRMKA